MMIKDIVTHIDHTNTARHACNFALEFAKQHDAVLHAVYVDNSAVWLNSLGIEMSPGVIDAQREIAVASKSESKQVFESMTKAYKNAAHWLERTGDVAVELTQVAHSADCIVLGHPWESSSHMDSALVNAVALGAGRPLLVVPHESKLNADFRRVVLAWDGGREAARAIHDAIPLLHSADQIQLVVVGNEKYIDTMDLESIEANLIRHQITVKKHRIVETGMNKAATLYDFAKESNCDLIVMGCYGHSRWREMVLGGCTRYMLKHTSVPLLMSH